MTEKTLLQQVEEAPAPLEGPPIFELPGKMEDLYGVAALAVARAMLIVCRENPSLLDVPSREEDPSGLDAAFNDKPWKAAKERFPGLDDWLGGLTGFQFGLAHNAVREILGREQVGNPALMSVREKS